MTKRCVIFSGGEPVSRETVDLEYIGGALIIAADKGLELADDLGIEPDVILGDFDSLTNIPKGDNVKIYPVEKDDTDLMLAVKEGLSAGCVSFTVYGATGGRTDHLLGNIQSLKYMLDHGASGEIVSDSERITLLDPGEYTFPAMADRSFSLIAYSEAVEGVTLRGTKYPLENACLSYGFPLGISNKIVEDRAEISFKKGCLLVICSRLFTDF